MVCKCEVIRASVVVLTVFGLAIKFKRQFETKMWQVLAVCCAENLPSQAYLIRTSTLWLHLLVLIDP